MQFLAPLTLALEDWNITVEDLAGDVGDDADEFFALPRLVRAHIEPCGPVAEAMTPWRRDAIAAATKKAASGQPDKAAAPAAKVEYAANARPTARKATAAVVQLSEEDFQEDWYELLGLTAIGEAATEEQIRAAFRRRCLETHPDKYQGSDELFKKVGRAFEILNNADAKRSFDSAREFDETIPDEKVAPDQFYEQFGSTFSRNMRFSTVPTSRTIGDDTTPVADVQAFYDFWLSFRSWRDFSHAAELEEIHEGMAREEKRYYARENERILSGLKKQESKRIRNLVDRAMANDPRLKRHAAEEEAKRLEAQRARQEALEYARGEAQRKRDEEARKIVEAEEAVKRKAADERAAVKAGKVKVAELLEERGFFDSGFKSLAFDDDVVRSALVDWVFKTIPSEEAPKVAALVEGWSKDDTVKQFNAMVEAIEKRKGITRYGEPVKKEQAPPAEKPKPAPAANVATAVWGDEDILALKRAIAKFPGGSVDRWRRIATALREKYTEEQVLAKTKELEANMRAGAGAQDAAATAATAAAPAAAAAAAASAAATEEEWTPKQQQQLEAGLRALKDYKEKDKFIKVAEYVDGKTAKQCFERFKYLCSLAKPAPKK